MIAERRFTDYWNGSYNGGQTSKLECAMNNVPHPVTDAAMTIIRLRIEVSVYLVGCSLPAQRQLSEELAISRVS